MTVAELIAKLQAFDGNKEVKVYDHHERCFTGPVVESHSKQKQVVLVLARPWHSPWSGGPVSGL
jgi:hypothetical protein